MKDLKPKNVNEYISGFPKSVQKILKEVRSTIKSTAPEADESISYAMPAYKLNGKPLVYFAGYEKHIGFYATPTGHEKFKKELAKYKQGKGSVQFPLDEPLPVALIEKIVRFRISEQKVKKTVAIHEDILKYNDALIADDKTIGEILAAEITRGLPKADNKIWHGHPVWFLDGNPIAGYSKQKKGIRLMFWSGASFDEDGLAVRGAKFKDASVFYNDLSEINIKDLKRWLKKSSEIQWDYKNIVKRKGVLERLK